MQIYFLLTEDCNLNCSMCIRGKKQGSDMDIEQLKQIMENNDLSDHDIVITGGEPSLHENYLDIVLMMSQNAKTVTVTSNGTLNLQLDKLRNLENLFFQISLDGDKKIHDQIRGSNTFDSTWHTLQMMEFMEIGYSVASVVSKKNRSDIFDLIDKLSGLKKMAYWRVSYEMPFGNASGIDDIMSAEEWNFFVDNLLKKVNFRLKIKKLFPFNLYEKRWADLEKTAFKCNRSINCGSGINKIYVYPDLKVYPCTCLTDFCVGELGKQSFSEIMNGEKIKLFSEYSLKNRSDCQDCKYKNYCNGGCIGMSYHYFGKLGMGDLRCPKLSKK